MEVKNAPRREAVIYQLEDTGHPALRLRPTLRIMEEDGERRFLYRVDAFSRLTGAKLGQADILAAEGSPAEFAAEARQFQSEAFQDVVKQLSQALIARFGGDGEGLGAVQR